MADIFVAASGSNTSPYDTWAKAAPLLETALSSAADGDRVIIQYNNPPAELTADWARVSTASFEIISASNDGGSSFTPTPMGTSHWLGHSTTNYSWSVITTGQLYCYGLTIRTAGSTADYITICGNGSDVVFDNCYLWCGNTNTGANLFIGQNTQTSESHVTLKNCTIRFGHVDQRISMRAGGATFENCAISSDGSAITALLSGGWASSTPVVFEGCDLSYVNSTLVADQTSGSRYVVFRRCKFPSSYTLLAAQTEVGKSAADVFAFDCSSGDTHINIEHANALGTTTVDTGIYATSNICDANLSWKIVGTSGATSEMPYQSPWIEVYHTGTSAITPSLECVRSGSSTAYNNNQVWSEWSYKGTSGSAKSTFVNDGMALAGSAAAQTTGALGASDWTGENATSWFGKLSPTASFTPAEVGHICARVCVAGANTVYVDPQIRGLS